MNQFNLDFDGALYHVTCSRDTCIFTVSIKLKFYKDFEKYGTNEVCFVLFSIRLFVYLHFDLGSSS